MAKIGNSAVRIIDESNLPANVNDAGRLEVDVASLSIGDVTVALDSADDSVECIQDTAADLNATVNLVDVTALATHAKQLGAGHTVDCDDSDVNVTNMISGFATSDNQLADGHAVTIDNVNTNEVFIAGGATQAANVKVSIENGGFDGVVTGTVGHNITGMVSDRDVDVGTTAEKIHTAADVAIKRIDIQADPDNFGYIYVGDNGVAGDGTGGGIRLAAGDFYSLDIDNTADVYVAASIAYEDVYYTYYI